MPVDTADLALIVGESARLKKQVDDLQESNTRLVEEKRAVDRRVMVMQFHRLGDVPVLDVPQVPEDARVRLRLRLITEEFSELLTACFKNGHLASEWDDAIGRILVAIEDEPIGVNLPEAADALADLDYVIEGAALEFGVDLNAVFRGVHGANCQKFGPGASKREDGKVQKPPGWEPFDVAAELRRQGWRP